VKRASRHLEGAWQSTEVEFVAFPKVINEVSIDSDPSLLSMMEAESMMNPTAIPLRFFLLGATGRTGLPFLAQALARGHFVTIFVHDVSKLPVALASHPRLRTFTGELHEADKMARAMGEANPDVVFAMLASETAPYTGLQVGLQHFCHSVELAHFHADGRCLR
jgi:hypothetical protein